MNAAFWVVVVAVAVRLVFAGATGLGIDESYMVASAHSFDASYFDHPLVSWWLELGARALAGGADPLVVRLPFVVLSAVSSGLVWLITVRLYGERAAFWAVVAYSISPVFSLAAGCWVLPDGPVDAALLGFAYCALRGLETPRWWIAAGLCAGLALLSKYNAALVLSGFAAGMLLSTPGRAALRRPELWAGVALAVALASPIVVWNAAHHWASFAYQGGRATGLHLRPAMPFTIWGGEALFVLPWLWLPMVGLLMQALARGPREPKGWHLACGAVLPVVLFAVVGLWSSTRILYHWAAPGYLLLFPLLGDWASRMWAGLRDAVTAVSAALLASAALLLVAVCQLGLSDEITQRFIPGASPLLQLVDWDSLATQIPPGVDAVAALRWFDAGKIGYALRNVPVAVTVFGPEPHEFGISAPPAALLGKTVLIVAMPGSVTQVGAQFAPDFRTLTPGPALTVMDHGQVLLVMPTFIGRDMVRVP
jgi:4-amino-4-deoxy-L-arabinose transferase-like glycosyltransferase